MSLGIMFGYPVVSVIRRSAEMQSMTLLDGFLVALNIIVLMMWVWRQWP